jgi:peptidoglycan-associated lipoprotein
MTLQMISRHSAWAILALTGLLAIGCGNRENTLPDASVAEDSNSDPSFSGADGRGRIDESEVGGGAGRDEQRLLDQLVVYFDYDEIEIRSEFNAMLAAHGRRLAQNPRTMVRLEGHADERGSREYNIGLGERRAQAVRRVLMLQGAAGEQLSTVSYGEERPAAVGSDEEAWGLNRRVELIYRQ